jgi:hypothetical protein
MTQSKPSSVLGSNQDGISKVYLAMAGVIVIVIVAILFLSLGKSPAKNNTSSTTTMPSQYKSTNDNFSINFPSSPKVTTSTFNSPTAGEIPLTTYREQDASGSENIYYTVYVYHYPSSYQFASDYLNVALEAYATALSDDYPGSSLSTQKSTTVLGNTAIYGLLTVPLKSSTDNSTTNTPDYVTITIKNKNVYEISSYGIPQRPYNSFVSSFRYL